MTASRPAPTETTGDGAAATRVHLRLVATPQPPQTDPGRPAQLTLPGVAVPRPAHRPGPRPRPDRPARPDADFGPAWSARADLPPAAATGRSVLLLALEVFAERRPVTQLRPVTTPRLFAAIAAGRRPAWCARGSAPLVLGRVHVCEPVDGVAEVSAVAHRSGRAHAVAARLEGIDGRWRCTALQIG
jgi:Family of unknown function (DUF6459)